MNVAEYTKALQKLPFNYKVLPFDEVRCCIFKSKIILSHPKEKPIIFEQNEWALLSFSQAITIK